MIRRASAAASSSSIYNSPTPEDLRAEMMKHYAGHFGVGRDRDVF